MICAACQSRPVVIVRLLDQLSQRTRVSYLRIINGTVSFAVVLKGQGEGDVGCVDETDSDDVVQGEEQLWKRL